MMLFVLIIGADVGFSSTLHFVKLLEGTLSSTIITGG